MSSLFPAITNGRRQVCLTCPTPCSAYTTGQLHHDDPAASCPAEPPRWRPTATYLVRPRRTVGLGDAVASVAQPIARAIDLVAGTKVAKCKGCGARSVAWNQAVPDVLRPWRRHPQPPQPPRGT